MKIVDNTILDKLAAEAATRPRRRLNLNFHQSTDEPIQRMFNALAVDTYVRPHRHPQAWELFVHIRGQALLLTFSEDGAVSGRYEMGSGRVSAVEIPAGTWHSVVSLSDDAAILEVKAGPFIPTAPEDFASWAPAEGEGTVPAFLDWMKISTPGTKP